MRLVHTQSLEMREFSDSERPDYAILSHRWESEEVNLQQWTDPKDRYRDWRGYRKVEDFCNQAASDGFEWAWADTCCINKAGNDNELSEAINSMYTWYQNAGKCYVYLSDVTDPNGTAVPASELEQILWPSQWFTRGWTLQELIAPREALFFDSQWKFIGSRDQLASILSNITRVDRRLLKGQDSLESFSVAQKMSWAAFRRTERSEDRAYSLFGLFKITLPTIYGEGYSAFRRLQEEIMRTSSDQSLFAWVLAGPVDFSKHPISKGYGILAPSPDCFYASSSIVEYKPFKWQRFWKSFSKAQCSDHKCVGGPNTQIPDSGPYGMTNKGLQITLLTKRFRVTNWVEAALYCYDESMDDPRPCTIILEVNNRRDEPHYLGEVRKSFHWAKVSHWEESILVIPLIWVPPLYNLSTGRDLVSFMNEAENFRDEAHDEVRRLLADERDMNERDRDEDKKTLDRLKRRKNYAFYGTLIAGVVGMELVKKT